MLDATAAEILVVDDTPANLKLLVNLLTEQRYRVRPASSGALALRSATAKPPDLILLDVRMPDLDGYAVCQQLKADPQTRTIPVIFISALHEVTDKIQGFAAGGVDYITKPFEPAEVLARVKTHLELRCLQQHLEQRVEARTAELAEANRTLRDSQERLALALAASNQGLYDLKLVTGQAVYNDEYARMLGYEPSELVELTPAIWASWLHPGDRKRILRLYKACATGRQSDYRAEFRLRTRTGNWLWVLSMGKIVEWDATGRPLRLVGTQLDITAHKQTEKALRLAELSIMQSVDAVFWVIPDGRFINVNDQACHSLGYTRNQLLTMAVCDIDPNFSREEWPLHWERIRQLKRHRFETRHQRQDGSIFPVEVTANHVEYEGQEYHFVFVRDITERKRAEAELQRHQDHLEGLVAERTAELRRAMHQLVQTEKLAALGQLVAGVAHELNTPLGNTRTVASALGEELGAFAAAVESGNLRRSQVETFLNRGREAVDLLERNAARAADLISHFKQVAVDQTSRRRRRFGLRQTVEEVLTTLRPQFKHTAHRFEVDIPAHLELDSYPGPLEQIITNLVSNSLIHGFEGVTAGVIQIHAAPLDADQVRLDYTDNGVGIPEKILNRLFEPFFTTKLGHGGSGLGLYIVYNLITGVLGGTIHVRGQPGHGATFTLILPRVAPTPSILVTPA